MDKLLVKCPALKASKMFSWINCFLTNCTKQVRRPLKSSEIENQREFSIKEEQHPYSKCETFELSKQELNLKLNEEGLYKYYSRIQREYPICVPRESKLAGNVFEMAHIYTIHEGVILTTAKVRPKHWVPTLRQLLKSV